MSSDDLTVLFADKIRTVFRDKLFDSFAVRLYRALAYLDFEVLNKGLDSRDVNIPGFKLEIILQIRLRDLRVFSRRGWASLRFLGWLIARH